MGQADAIITSPPYADQVVRPRDADNLAGVPVTAEQHWGRTGPAQGHYLDAYGTAPGQVGALKSGPCPGGEAGVGDDVETLTWGGCYSQGWGRGLLSPGAFAHPAKFAYGLLTRLYDHGFERGWWAKGSLVVDPFGGVGCGGVVAAYRGLKWMGVELEPRFVALAEETFAQHRGKWAAAGDVPPVILRGDSRRFAALVAGAAACVTSPPWVDPRALSPRDNAAWVASGRLPAEGSGPGTDLDAYGTTPGQLGALPQGDADGVITSPPYADTATIASGVQRNEAGWGAGKDLSAGKSKDYGATPGQLGALRAGDAEAVLTSPPYAASVHGRNGIDLTKCDRPGAYTQAGAQGYGDTPGNVGSLRSGPLAFCAACGRMIPDTQRSTTSAGTAPTRLCAACAAGSSLPVPSTHASVPLTATAPAGVKETVPGGHDEFPGGLAAGDADGVVTSPPYEGCEVADLPRSKADGNITGGIGAGYRQGKRGKNARKKADGTLTESYGTAPGQVGALRQETYWGAMAVIWQQAFLALRPNGVLCCVIKDFVRAKKRVPLCDQTWRLLLSLGFLPVERVRCLLSEETREPSLFGGEEVRKRERKSFFRRLHERKFPGISIDFEEVLVVRKPYNEGVAPRDALTSGGRAEPLSEVQP